MKKGNRCTQFRHVLTFLLVLVMSLVFGIAMGQDVTNDAKADDDAFALEEIVVTAQFQQQNVQDTPIAITAISSEMMEARNQINLPSIAGQAPSVILTQTGGGFGPGMSANIRAVGQHDFNPAYEPGVGIYIDDVYYPSLTGANFDLLDLSRVEIARGPQGVLGGRNSEGGSIKLYSQKPQGNGTGSLRATYGTRNLLDIRAVGDFSVAPDTLFMRLSAVSKKQDGYLQRYDYGCLFPNSGVPDLGQQADCRAGTEGGKDYSATRAALRWLVSDAVEVNLSADYSMDNSEPTAITLQDALSPAEQAALGLARPPKGSLNSSTYGVEYGKAFVPADPYTSYASYTSVQPDGRTVTFSPTTRTEVWGTNLTVDWSLSDSLAVKSITAYREFDSKFVSDNDVSPMSGTLGANHLYNDSFSEELRLIGILFNEAVDYTLGAYYFDQSTTYETHQIMNYVVPGYEFRGDDPVDATSYAAFFNTSWHVTDAMNVNLGARYTHEEKDYAFSRHTVGASTASASLEALNGVVGKYEGDKVDYRVNVDYRFTDQVLAYASVSTAFKGGGTNPRPFFASQVVPFGREDLTAYELGAKTDWLNKRLRVNVAGFFNKYDDIQLTLLSCPMFTPSAPCAAPFNAGDAEIKGVELEVTAMPIEGLLIELSGSNLDFEYTSLAPNTGLTVGQTAPRTIETKYSIGAQYGITLANGSTVTPRLDYVYQDEFHTGAKPTDSNLVEDYGLLNGRLTWRSSGGEWELALIGLNLTDKEYYLSNFDLLASSGAAYAIIGPPREYAVQIKKNFF